MDPIIGSALISGGAGLLGSATQMGAGRKNYMRSRKLMERQFDLNKQMYDYQNAYNTPAAQMARLKAAGLNPALMYGQGTTGNATDYPKAQQNFTPTTPFDPTHIFNGLASAMNQVLTRKQIQEKDATIQETKSRTTLNAIEAAVKGGTVEESKGLIKQQLENLKTDNMNKLQQLMNLNVQEKILNKDLSVKQQELESKQIENAMKRMDQQWMKKNGLSRLDPTVIKMLWRMGNKTYEGLKMLLQDIVNGNDGNRPWNLFQQ